MTDAVVAPVVAKKEYIWGTGRRREAVARVRLSRGTGIVTVNRRAFNEYFTTEEQRQEAMSPFHITKAGERYDVFITANGGGMTGQAGAVKLGLARALSKVEPALEQVLRGQGFLTRDPRMKERKKYGLRGARRGVQYSKR